MQPYIIPIKTIDLSMINQEAWTDPNSYNGAETGVLISMNNQRSILRSLSCHSYLTAYD